MAPRKCYITNQVLDLDRILQESQHRWLRPLEICEILRNHHKFQLTPTPPTTPPAGSLFLFDKKVVRCFRKDGHRWRKKKDGKTVKEAHEKLKAGNVDVLHCYYAHGEENGSFQRRSYWMLDEPFENIVLVHYRDVKEGYQSGVSHGSQSGLSPSSEQTALLDRTLPTDPNLAHQNDENGNPLGAFHLEPPTTGIQSDTVSVGSRQQRFSILDYAPVRAVSRADTNVLVAGVFSDDVKWCCMFGEIEVPAEVVTANTIRCRVPARAAGRVPFYVTCGDGLACSEVREFEYLDRSSRAAARRVSAREEFGLLVRFGKLVSSRPGPEWAGCSAVDCEACGLKSTIRWIQQHKDTSGRRVTTSGNVVDLLMRNLVKDRFCEWLVYDAHRAYQGLRAVDGEGQGVVHLAAALRYEWAIAAIAATGGGLNFRDARGRTALHWAALYGREETVAALVGLGASAGAVDDPTPWNPAGQTAADLASSSGHKGIAGYLAEADLTSRLSAVDGHPSPPRPSGETDDARCLEAVTKSAHAAALIQDALRARSATSVTVDEFPDPRDVAALVSLHNVRKTGRFDDYLHSRIHQKHRNESVKIRERIVNAQARQRGRRAPRRYDKWVWAVGIIEKAVLRWRRRSRGLRGFTAAADDDGDEYDFLRVGREQKRAGVERALARVRSMARDPVARDQYTRVVSR